VAGVYRATVTDRAGRGRRPYRRPTAGKGIVWLRLTAHGRAGHGSVPNDENAIVRLAETISRIAAHKWPREFIPSVRTLPDGPSEIQGVPVIPVTPPPADAILKGPPKRGRRETTSFCSATIFLWRLS